MPLPPGPVGFRAPARTSVVSPGRAVACRVAASCCHGACGPPSPRSRHLPAPHPATWCRTRPLRPSPRSCGNHHSNPAERASWRQRCPAGWRARGATCFARQRLFLRLRPQPAWIRASSAMGAFASACLSAQALDLVDVQPGACVRGLQEDRRIAPSRIEFAGRIRAQQLRPRLARVVVPGDA